MSRKSDAILEIEAGKLEKQYLKDIWSFRELFFFLVWRDFLVRYKQTAIGFLWAFIKPAITLVIFSVLFGSFAHLPNDGVPYPLLVISGLIPWTFFANAMSESSNSLINNSNLISKVYFPRLIVPSSTIILSFVDFIISFLILIILMIWFKYVPPWQLITLPFFIIIALVASLGSGMWLSALNIKYRDFRQITPFIVQIGAYISPVAFSQSIIPGQWRLLYSLNPMVGVIDGFRWAILGGKFDVYIPGLILSIVLVTVIFITGFRYFRKTERIFADII